MIGTSNFDGITLRPRVSSVARELAPISFAIAYRFAKTLAEQTNIFAHAAQARHRA
jgi:hypothetical protein